MWMITLGGLFFITFLIGYFSQKKYTLPPGPWGLPVVGNAFQMEKGKSHKTITEWSKRYGNIYMIKMFRQNIVIVHGYESIYEVLVKKSAEYGGRPLSLRTRTVMDCDGIALSTFSRKWNYMKKTTIMTLKMYGDTMEKLERISLMIIDDMLDEIREASREKQAFDIVPIFYRCTTAIMTSILYGKKETKEKVTILADLTVDIQNILNPVGNYAILDLCPWLRFLPLSIIKNMYDVGERTEAWYFAELLERKEKFIPGDPECFIDGLFDHQRVAEEQQSEYRLSNKDISGITKELIVGGTLTTTTTLSALVVILVHNPDIQQRSADEISTVIKERSPCLADRPSLPYTEAVILEILRYSSILPLNLGHYTMVDTVLNGYDIPKNTTVLANLWSLHHNEEYWDEPWKFKPERFLDSDGKLVSPDHINRKRLLPFGASRRVCPGENLAKNRLFLIVTSLMQHFQFLPESQDKMPDKDPRNYEASINILVPQYKIKVANRK